MRRLPQVRKRNTRAYALRAEDAFQGKDSRRARIGLHEITGLRVDQGPADRVGKLSDGRRGACPRALERLSSRELFHRARRSGLERLGQGTGEYPLSIRP